MKTLKMAIASLLISASASAANLHVNITNLRNLKGQLIVAVFKQTEFKSKKKAVVIEGKEVRFFLKPGADNQLVIELPPDEYAIGVVHDEDGDGKFDRI